MSRLRLLTWNLWHALNPYGGALGLAVMRPMQSPAEARERRRRQLEVLRSLRRSPGDVFCLQEVNPIPSREREIAECLGWRGHSCRVNAGIKLGRVGIPPGLEEGLAIFAAQGFAEISFGEKTLSGWGVQCGPVSFQLGERRRALFFQARLEGIPVAVVNLHLHNGSDSDPQALRRKTGEVRELVRLLDSWQESGPEQARLIAVCGDFNSDPGSPCMVPLLEAGFVEITGPEPTWQPQANPLAALSGKSAPSELLRQWDEAPHVFDRVYLRMRSRGTHPEAAPPRARCELIREEGLSDHYASCVEIEIS